MNVRHTLQKALRKTSKALLNAEARLEPDAKDDLIKLLKNADIPTPVLIETLDYLQHQLEELEEMSPCSN